MKKIKKSEERKKTAQIILVFFLLFGLVWFGLGFILATAASTQPVYWFKKNLKLSHLCNRTCEDVNPKQID